MICALVVTFVVFCKGVPSLDPDLHDDLKTCALLFFNQYACVANVISLIRSFVLLTEVTTWWY